MRRGGTVVGDAPPAPAGGPAPGPAPAAPPPTAAAAFDTALARVDLLPDWVHVEARVREVRRRFAVGLAAAVVLVGAAWGAQQWRLADVRGDLAAEESAGQQLTASIDGLRPVETYVAGVAARQREVGTVLGTDVALDRLLKVLDRALPAGAQLQDLAVTLPLPGQAPAPVAGATGAAGTTAPPAENRGLVADCPGPDPFGSLALVGCATLTGTVPDRQALAALLRNLADAGVLTEPFVDTSTTEEDGPVTFSGSVGITAEVFSGQYDDLLADAAPAPDQETTP